MVRAEGEAPAAAEKKAPAVGPPRNSQVRRPQRTQVFFVVCIRAALKARDAPPYQPAKLVSPPTVSGSPAGTTARSWSEQDRPSFFHLYLGTL